MAFLELDVAASNSRILDVLFDMLQVWIKLKPTERCAALIEANNVVGLVYITHNQVIAVASIVTTPSVQID